MLDVVVNEHSVDDNVSWCAYHALQCTEAAGMNYVNASLPVSLNVINQAVQHTNPNQSTGGNS